MIMTSNPNSVEAVDHYTDVLDQLDETKELEKVLSSILVEKNEQIIRVYENSYNLFFKYA